MDGLTMTKDFCDDLVDACTGQGNIVFPSYGELDYCEKHTGTQEDDLFWAYPYEEGVDFLCSPVRTVRHLPCSEDGGGAKPRRLTKPLMYLHTDKLFAGGEVGVVRECVVRLTGCLFSRFT